MAETTAIEWTDHTFNTHWGCSKISDGCTGCYAETLARRFGYAWGDDAPKREFAEKHWNDLLRWDRKAAAEGVRRRVFTNSMSDLFDKFAPEGVRERHWSYVARTPNLDHLLLTKRVGNVRNMVPPAWFERWPANVWLGSTVVNQEEADRDIPKLFAIPAIVRFLSIEPMLGPINLDRWLLQCCGNSQPGNDHGVYGREPDHCCGQPEPRDGIDWIIAGAESGPHARPLQLDWVRSIVQQCKAAAVPVLVKQLGAAVLDHGMSSPGQHWPAGTVREPRPRIVDADPGFVVRLKASKGGDWLEWPEDLRVREFPQ